MKTNEILISVIMGIYNCERTLEEAIDCILKQTEKSWELIMCDDGSSDCSYDIAMKYQKDFPAKIRVLKNEKNIGLNATLNKCLAVAKGKYIARMDGDDICAPNRFEEELKVLETRSDISIVSTDMEHFDETGIWGYVSHPQYPTKRDLLAGTPFCHAPCMVRKEAYNAVGGYSVSKRLLRVEDYHLWFKMYLAGFKGVNIHKPLYQMRDDRSAYNRRKFKYRINEAYVKYCVIKEMKFPIWTYIYVVRPIIVGIVPSWLYDKIHKYKLCKRK